MCLALVRKKSEKVCSTVLGQVRVVVQLGPVSKAPGPGKDAGNGVGRGLLSLLVLAVVTGYGAVGSFSLDSLAIGTDQDRGHEAERAIALGNHVRLDITVVVLAGPNKLAARFEGLGHHVINETMLVPDVVGLKVLLVLPRRS